MAKKKKGFEVVKILLSLLYRMPAHWADGVTEEEYVKVATYLIDNDPDLYGDMVEDSEHLFDEETLKKAGYA